MNELVLILKELVRLLLLLRPPIPALAPLVVILFALVMAATG